MAKKLKKKQKPVKRVKITEEEYLQNLIGISERSITSQGTTIDDFFRHQAERLRKQLAELKKRK